jgi:predicted 2-oxoglutarate/Fe(II)-dependent dioxygenase YbiX
MLKFKVIPNALSKKYCDELILNSYQKLTPAMFWSKGERVYDAKVRCAYNLKIDLPDVSTLSCQLASELSDEDIDVRRAERCEIVCYPPGNGNERHVDGPLRSHSIVYFINEGYEGGELEFDSGEKFSGLESGTAVIWENTDTAFHACLPITKGFKWIIVNWIGHQIDRNDEEPQTDKVYE